MKTIIALALILATSASAQTKAKPKPFTFTADNLVKIKPLELPEPKNVILTGFGEPASESYKRNFIVEMEDMPAGAPDAQACNLGRLVRAAEKHMRLEHPGATPISDLGSTAVRPIGLFSTSESGPVPFYNHGTTLYGTTLQGTATIDPCEPQYINAVYCPNGCGTSVEQLRAKAACLSAMAESMEAENRKAVERETERIAAEQALLVEIATCKPKATIKGARK